MKSGGQIAIGKIVQGTYPLVQPQVANMLALGCKVAVRHIGFDSIAIFVTLIVQQHIHREYLGQSRSSQSQASPRVTAGGTWRETPRDNQGDGTSYNFEGPSWTI